MLGVEGILESRSSKPSDRQPFSMSQTMNSQPTSRFAALLGCKVTNMVYSFVFRVVTTKKLKCGALRGLISSSRQGPGTMFSAGRPGGVHRYSAGRLDIWIRSRISAFASCSGRLRELVRYALHSLPEASVDTELKGVVLLLHGSTVGVSAASCSNVLLFNTVTRIFLPKSQCQLHVHEILGFRKASRHRRKST